jgi:hypothetical protein
MIGTLLQKDIIGQYFAALIYELAFVKSRGRWTENGKLFMEGEYGKETY